MPPRAEPPINRLPPELLALILELRAREQDLVTPTHVCRYWRAALISAPCLWARIPCYCVGRTSTYLERSKSAPIDVLAMDTPSATPSDSALELVIPHLKRVRSMKISPFLDQIFQAILNFRSPAPLLQHLEISGYPPLLPVDFLGGHTPSLQFLRWGRLPSGPEPFDQPNPTHLPFHDEDVAQPLGVVLGLLSSAPYLQHVSIAIPDGDVYPDATPTHHLQFNSLRYLNLVSGVTFSRVIPYIKAPRLKEFSFTLPSSARGRTVVDLLPSDFYPLIREATTMDVRRGLRANSVKLEGEGTKVTVVIPYQAIEDMDGFFNSAISPFSFTPITKLTFKTMAGPLALRIGEFTNLQQLNLIRCEGDVEIFFVLSPLIQLAELVPCPYLKAVTVELYNPSSHAVNTFMEMLRWRKEAENPLTTVDIVGFYRWRRNREDVDELLGPTPVL